MQIVLGFESFPRVRFQTPTNKSHLITGALPLKARLSMEKNEKVAEDDFDLFRDLIQINHATSVTPASKVTFTIHSHQK